MDRLNKSLLSMLAALTLTMNNSTSTYAAADGSQFSQSPAVSSPLLQSSNSKRIPANIPVVRSDSFEINYSLAQESKQYVSRIELWCGRGTTGPWQLYDYDLDLEPPVSFRAASEGIWRFLVVPVDINGMRYYKGSEKAIDKNGAIPASVPAQTTIFIDYTQPQIFLHEPIVKTTANGLKQVVVQWNVFDTFLDEHPATLYWIETGGNKWNRIGTAFKAFDSYKWIVPRNVTKPVCFKLECQDQAGNTCQMVTSMINPEEGGNVLAASPYDNRQYVLSYDSTDKSQPIKGYRGLPDNIPTDTPLLSTDITGIKTRQGNTSLDSSIQPYIKPGISAPGAKPVDIKSKPEGLHPDTQMENAMPTGKALIEPASKEWDGNKSQAPEQYELSTRAADYLELGRQSYEKGEYERARKLFEQVIKLEPTYIDTYYDLADVLRMQGKFLEAKKYFTIFLKQRPNHKNALIGLMWCHLSLNEMAEARDILNNKIKQLNNSDKWNDLLDKR